MDNNMYNDMCNIFLERKWAYIRLKFKAYPSIINDALPPITKDDIFDYKIDVEVKGIGELIRWK